MGEWLPKGREKNKIKSNKKGLGNKEKGRSTRDRSENQRIVARLDCKVSPPSRRTFLLPLIPCIVSYEKTPEKKKNPNQQSLHAITDWAVTDKKKKKGGRGEVTSPQKKGNQGKKRLCWNESQAAPFRLYYVVGNTITGNRQGTVPRRF